MQLYCEACHAVFSEGYICPLCHKRGIREVRDHDICFFSEQTALMATVVENLLKQEGLHFIMKPVYGAGISSVTGQFLDSMRFYTYYTDYAKACALMETMFPTDENEPQDNDNDVETDLQSSEET